MSEAVLFLDVDGVLNHVETFMARKTDMLAVECVACLDRLVEATCCKIVLSSAWRGMPGLEARLRRRGVLKHRIKGEWRTPRLGRVQDGSGWVSAQRGDEIADWLSRHPEVTAYAIVDDESDMRPEQMPFFVQTDFHKGGLLSEHVDRLTAILAPSNPEPGQ